MIEIEKAVKIAFNKEKKSEITVQLSFPHSFIYSFDRSFTCSFFLPFIHSQTYHLCKRNPLQKCC